MPISMTDKSPKTYVVLGSPRSGTSFITKALEEQGVKMGSDNEEFYENLDFVKLNNDMLDERNKGKDFSKRIKGLIKKYKSQFWGWKDPRTSLTIDKILPHLEDDVYLICMFRKPERVSVWNPDEYNRSIIKAVKKFVNI